MFHFPASTPTQTMHSPAGNTTQPVLGFPIRTSSDQRFVDNSPRHNAASHVLHRLSMPRHPPYALNNQTHYPTHTTHTTHHKNRQTACADTQNTYKRSCKHKTCKTQKIQPTPHKHGAWKEERCSRPLYSSHTTHPHHNNHTNRMITAVQANKTTTTTLTHGYCVLPQTPNSMPTHLQTCLRFWLPPRSATQALHVLRVCIHPEFQTIIGGSHTLGDSTTLSHNRGHNKTKAP